MSEKKSNTEIVENEEVKPKKVIEKSKEYVCPLEVNYLELEMLLNGKTIAEYVGKNLPSDEVERISKDYELFLKNK